MDELVVRFDLCPVAVILAFNVAFIGHGFVEQRGQPLDVCRALKRVEQQSQRQWMTLRQPPYAVNLLIVESHRQGCTSYNRVNRIARKRPHLNSPAGSRDLASDRTGQIIELVRLAAKGDEDAIRHPLRERENPS